MMKQFRYVNVAWIIVILSTCSPAQSQSLWSDDSPFNFLMTDANASKVGDILSIIVQEDNRANDVADGEGKREQKIDGLFGLIWNNPLMQKAFGGANNGPGLKWDSTNEFTGESQIDRSNQFNSRISATIVRIDPAGNYLIEARKSIHIGQERKTIVLSGKVRPRDVINNQVFSWQVADAEISYVGDGTLGNMANPTFFQKLFNFLF